MILAEADTVFYVFFLTELLGDFREDFRREWFPFVGGEQAVDALPVGLIHREEHQIVIAIEDEGSV